MLAEDLYGDAAALLRFDMTEFMERHTAARLTGAPPGYVGYGEGGELTERVRRRPYSIVLLDEIEKAHPDVAGLTLQIMEEGELTDGTGRKTDFRNTVLVMTSNLGAKALSGATGPLGFGSGSGGEDQALAQVRERFSPEFLGRLDGVILFRPLDAPALTQIAGLELDRLCRRAEDRGLRLRAEAEAAVLLAEGCQKLHAGARGIRNLIRSQVEGPLAEGLLAGTLPDEGEIVIAAREGELVLRPADERMPGPSETPAAAPVSGPSEPPVAGLSSGAQTPSAG